MTHDSTLLVNLVFAVGVAFLSALVAVRLRQSVILGYLIAGVVIGPFTPGFVGDIGVVQQLADIGIILLMFSVGLQVSVRDLLRSGLAALVGGNVQVLLTLGLGFLAGLALGWQPLEALLLGAVVSNSSSTVLTKILGERGELDSEHGHLSLAWSSVQDLGTVLMVVAFSTLAVGGEDLLVDSLWALGAASLFLMVAGPVGLVVLPRLFEWVAALRNRELFILMVTLVALGTAHASTFFGLSLALGAFIAGVVVGESDLSHQILGDVMPVRDIFSGLFFISVGMLVNPFAVVENPVVALLVLGLIVVAKGAMSALIPMLFGYSARAALLTGVTLAQSAEFSFLLARLGTDLGIVSQSSFSLMLGGVAASMALSPFLHQAAAPLARWLGKRVPSSALVERPVGEDPAKRLRGHAIVCGYGQPTEAAASLAPLERTDDQRVDYEGNDRVRSRLPHLWAGGPGRDWRRLARVAVAARIAALALWVAGSSCAGGVWRDTDLAGKPALRPRLRSIWWHLHRPVPAVGAALRRVQTRSLGPTRRPPLPGRCGGGLLRPAQPLNLAGRAGLFGFCGNTAARFR